MMKKNTTARPVPAKFKLIMLSAMYENGGNTTHRTFDGHPNLFVYPFESQVGTASGSNMMDAFVPIRYRWPEFPANTTPEEAYEMFWDEELKTLLRAPRRSKFNQCGLQMDERVRRKWFCDFLARRPFTRANAVEAFFRCTFATWSNYNHSGRESHYVGYNPVQVFDTDKIMRDWPDSQVVHVIRNPFSGFADTSKRPFPLPLLKYAWIWNICQHSALTYREKYAGRFHILRFEDLAASPRKAMGRLLQNLGLPASDQCSFASFNRHKLEQVYPWGTIKTPTPEANIATANELNGQQKRQIQTECHVMLDLCGYSTFYKDFLS
jgi:hypothetical protein